MGTESKKQKSFSSPFLAPLFVCFFISLFFSNTLGALRHPTNLEVIQEGCFLRS
jgi:hypothetical protein